MDRSLIRKALSVAVGGNLRGYLPDPVVADVIKYVREMNMMRRLFSSFKMNKATVTKPKKLGAMQAYFVPAGTTATPTQYNTGTVTWEAKKLMAFTAIDIEAEEDTIVNVVDEILADFGEAIGEAEELAFISGLPSHLANAPTPDSATEENWYQFDPRLICEGIFGVAASVDAAPKVNANGNTINLNYINRMIYNLGKFGRNRANLTGLMPSTQAAFVREDTNFKNASISGAALASFITGLGAAGEGQGIVSVIYNVPFYEVPQAPDDQLVIFDKRSPAIGDRRQIKVKSAEIIEADQEKYVISERVGLNYNYRNAMVACTGLNTEFEEESSVS